MLSITNSGNNFPQYFPQNMSGKLTFKVIIKKDHVRVDGTHALYLQVFLNKKMKRFPMRMSVKLSDFDTIKQRIKSSHPLYKDYNLIIEKSLAELNKIEVNYRLSNIPLSLEKLIEEYENPSSRADFVRFWEVELVKQEALIKKSTLRQQRSAWTKLKAFRSEISFYEINEDLIQELRIHFKKKGNSESTLSSFFKNFKKYLHLANKKGIITPIMHDDIKHAGFKSMRTFLTPAEIARMYDYWKIEAINPNHKNILGRFLFSCFTSVRVSDNRLLTEDNFMGDFIAFTAQKTGKFTRIALNQSAKLFVDPDHFLGESFTGEYMNRELKFIAKAVGIRKHLTFHVSRHTFATNYLMSGGRVEHLQKILGHSKIEDTMIYVHIVESITDIQIQNMDEILNLNNSR